MVMGNRLCKLLLSLTLVFWALPPCFAGQYQVARVVDGDTIRVRDGDARLVIRLSGVDAPEVSHSKNEPGQPFSLQATKHLAALVLGRNVEIKRIGQDRYGRTLAEVFVDGKNVNLQMVKDDLAEVYRGVPALGQNFDPYWKAEEEAKKAGRGMWVLGSKYVSPREWRRLHGN